MIIFFFNDTATTEIYTLSLHDALPIFADPNKAARLALKTGRSHDVYAGVAPRQGNVGTKAGVARLFSIWGDHDVKNKHTIDRKSTRLNSSHANISYAVFCLKKTNIDIV